MILQELRKLAGKMYKFLNGTDEELIMGLKAERVYL